MDKASEALYRLKPVTYRYKKEIDKTQSLAFGLIAEEVAEANPDLVAHNSQGQPESVHYEMVNAMLLNEFLKEHKKVEEQQSKIDNQQASIAELKATVAQQANGMEVLTAQLKQQVAQIQKVRARLEVNKPAPEVVTK
jgi:septal ring factor EnvC (AmiA/AmiB activator)